MLFTHGNTRGDYLPGMATSHDGVHWHRDDRRLGIGPSGQGWDSHVLCYPTLVEQADRWLMFYNGNDMGVDGFGVAMSPPPRQEHAHA